MYMYAYMYIPQCCIYYYNYVPTYIHSIIIQLEDSDAKIMHPHMGQGESVVYNIWNPKQTKLHLNNMQIIVLCFCALLVYSPNKKMTTKFMSVIIARTLKFILFSIRDNSFNYTIL